MRNLRKGKRNGLEIKETPRKIQPNHKKKKIPKFAVGAFGIGKKSQGLYEMHQGDGKEKIVK